MMNLISTLKSDLSMVKIFEVNGNIEGFESEVDLKKKLSKEPNLKFISEYVYPNGSIYRGQMKGENRHGYGIQLWPDGAKYEGHWNDNKAEGKGTFWHAEGDVY